MDEFLWKLPAIFIAGLFTYAVVLIRSRMGAGKSRDALIELTKAAQVVVLDLEQRLRPKLVAAASDGRLAPAERTEIKNEAMAALKDLFSNQGQKVLAAGGAHVDEAMSRAIEAEVFKLKTLPASLGSVLRTSSRPPAAPLPSPSPLSGIRT